MVTKEQLEKMALKQKEAVTRWTEEEMKDAKKIFDAGISSRIAYESGVFGNRSQASISCFFNKLKGEKK